MSTTQRTIFQQRARRRRKAEIERKNRMYIEMIWSSIHGRPYPDKVIDLGEITPKKDPFLTRVKAWVATGFHD